MSDTKIHPVLDEEKSMHERMANLPDIPELPQCTCQTLAISHNPAIPPKKVLCLVCSAFQEMNITREEYTAMRAESAMVAEARQLHAIPLPEDRLSCALNLVAAASDSDKAMRAAVERCAELETALARVTAERDEVQHYRANANDIATLNYKEAEGLRAELAKVTAQRDALSLNAKAIANAIAAEQRTMQFEDDAARDIPSDPHAAFVEGMFRAYAIARDWEHATPTEGDLPIEPTDTPKGGA